LTLTQRLQRFLNRAQPARLVPARVAYDLWAPTYSPNAHNPLMQAEQRAVGAILARLPARRALDVGTGSGRYLPVLDATGARTVVGLDRSPAMLARIRTGRALVRADALRLPFAREMFDIVNASLIAGDITDLAAWVTGLAGSLTRGGHLVYSDFHPEWTARGWRRTFRMANGRRVALPYVAHSVDAHLDAVRQAGLVIEAIHEPGLSPACPPAGRVPPAALPVLLVVHASKPGGPRHVAASR
jgi:malonyl-CoA O-methyltransferase